MPIWMELWVTDCIFHVIWPYSDLGTLICGPQIRAVIGTVLGISENMRSKGQIFKVTRSPNMGKMQF